MHTQKTISSESLILIAYLVLLVLLCGSPAPSLVLIQFVQRDVHHASDELEVDDGADCRRQRGADISRLRIFNTMNNRVNK